MEEEIEEEIGKNIKHSQTHRHRTYQPLDCTKTNNKEGEMLNSNNQPTNQKE